MSTGTPTRSVIEYPDEDGQPLAENTLQYRWIVTLHGNIAAMFANRGDVLVCADNLIYPVQGRVDIRAAPDVYVAIGRPAGDRGSYKVWEEDDLFSQVVFEVLSPGNRPGEMGLKQRFYERYGAKEYYIYDPDRVRLEGLRAGPDGFEAIESMHGYVSPLLGIRFDMSGDELTVYDPDGRPFRTMAEIMADEERTQAALRQSDADRKIAEAERQKAEAHRQRAEAERQKAETDRDRLKAMLRAAGIDPDAGG